MYHLRINVIDKIYIYIYKCMRYFDSFLLWQVTDWKNLFSPANKTHAVFISMSFGVKNTPHFHVKDSAPVGGWSRIIECRVGGVRGYSRQMTSHCFLNTKLSEVTFIKILAPSDETDAGFVSAVNRQMREIKKHSSWRKTQIEYLI